MIFEVKNGYFGYGKKNILNDVSFSISGGEVLSVLGSNGVGKTTMLKCTMGIFKWKRGRTLLDDVDILDMDKKELWKRIAYVPQAKGAASPYSALDMVILGRSAHIGTFAQPTEEDVSVALKAMEEIGIGHLKDKVCNKMSGGELQMVLIARALCSSPEVLILDEPESNLDFKNQIIILETIKELSKTKNISAIVNTHYPSHALQISDKALILNRNGTSCYGETSQIINADNMEKSFGVRVHIDEIIHNNLRYRNVIPLHLV